MPNPNIAQLGKESYGRPVGSKNKSTISKENARRIYEEKLAERFDKMTDVQFNAAVKEENSRERMYAIDQMIGKPTETKKIELEIDMDLEL